MILAFLFSIQTFLKQCEALRTGKYKRYINIFIIIIYYYSMCLQLTRNVLFNWNMDNFKFNFLSRGQLESLNLDRIFLPLFKILPC